MVRKHEKLLRYASPSFTLEIPGVQSVNIRSVQQKNHWLTESAQPVH